LARAAAMMNMSSLPFAALAARGSFARDARFAPPLLPPLPEREDPLTLAWSDGHSAGYAEAEAAAAALAEAEAAARDKLELSLARLDADLAEALRQRLCATVEVLCEAAIAPLALDTTLLVARVERAAAMLARADDERVLRLHPDDLTLIAGQLPEGLPVLPDPTLERGALRVETSNGGVEDGPEQWRRAITEALSAC
jgi:flagellar assembly protein FliH